MFLGGFIDGAADTAVFWGFEVFFLVEFLLSFREDEFLVAVLADQGFVRHVQIDFCLYLFCRYCR